MRSLFVCWITYSVFILIFGKNYFFGIVLRFNNNVNTVQITILVAAEGVYKLPAINSSMDLKEALQKLGSIPSNKTMVTISYTSTYWSFVLMRDWKCR